MDSLNMWYKKIECFRKIKIDEAKKMYISAINEKNEVKRKAIFDELIEGTLYAVLGYIRRNHFDIAIKTSVDMDDFISSFVEEWIRVIYSGKLLNVRAYSLLFHLDYYYSFVNSLKRYDYVIYINCGLSKTNIRFIFDDYMKYRNNNLDISYDKFIEIINKYGYYCSAIENYYNAYCLFNNIYNSMNIDRLGDCNITKTSFDYLKYLLIDNSLETNLDENITCRFEDNLFSKLYVDNIINCFNNSNLNDNEKYVLNNRGLFDNNCRSFSAIGKDLGVSHERASVIYERAIRKLRCKILSLGAR